MIIPEAVKQEAKYCIEHYGDRLRFLGKIEDGREAFCYTFPDDEETGFPEVYLYDGNLVMTITGFAALDIINDLDTE